MPTETRRAAPAPPRGTRPWTRSDLAARICALLVLASATAAPTTALAGAGLDCLACATVDRSTCPALERALAAPDITRAELGAWLSKAPADATTVRRAAAVLSMLGGPAAESALLAAAKRFADSPEVAVDLWAAAARSGQSEGAMAARETLASLASKGSPHQKQVAISNLSALDDKRVLDVARRSLDPAEQRLCVAAIGAIGRHGDVSDAPALLRLARADTMVVPVRRAALQALADLKAESAVVVASLLVGHPQRSVGVAALAVLAAVPQRWTAPVVGWALDVEGLEIAAAKAAVALADPNLAARTLAVATSTVRPLAVHEALLEAVVVLQAPRAGARLLQHQVALDEASRVATLRAIARLGDRTVIPALIDGLPNARGDVANFTVAALETLTGQRLGGDVAAWKVWLRGTPPTETKGGEQP